MNFIRWDYDTLMIPLYDCACLKMVNKECAVQKPAGHNKKDHIL